MATTPLLSIGMIFKNEERCLERCLKSLEPLRKAVPCELIMADTGAEDGSRAIAERYADEVFDFEWIDDFAAARNAVMDRCRGKWYFSIDCDEWLDADITELATFLTRKSNVDYAFVILRDYYTQELEMGEGHTDFHALRLARMSAGERYHKAIHESWIYREPAERLNHTILHHDGYFFTSAEAKKKKAQRNMKLLRQELEQNPEDLRTLHHCIESGSGEADYIQYIQRAVKLIQAQHGPWEIYGPVILSSAIEEADAREMPELQEWIAFAEKHFADSIRIQTDMNHAAFLAAYRDKDWERAIRYGEGYRKGLRRARKAPASGKKALDLRLGGLRKCSESTERNLLTGLANAYLQNGQSEKALELLVKLDGAQLNPGQVHNVVIALSQLHAETPLDVAPAMTAFYEQIGKAEPDEQKQKARLAAFDSTAAAAFSAGYRQTEQQHEGYQQPAYTAFRCLSDKCEAGRAAALMMAIEPEEIRTWLLQVEDWQALPIEALEYALREGVAFPLPEKPLNSEVLDGLAARLTQGGNMARQLALAPAEDLACSGIQGLFWAQGLVLAALRGFDWSLGKNSRPASKFACPEKKENETEDLLLKDTPETGLALIRRFARVEAALLPMMYTPQMLTDENAALLPPMHRWGAYCTRALQALDDGKPQKYLVALRKGLKACPGERDMVQFLLDRFQEDTRPKAGPELLVLADKIRAILAAYRPDDPAVKAIQESPAYKQVAWIIEGEAGRPAQPALPAYPPAKKPVRAVFFAELGEKWDAMQSVYEFMRRDPRFDPVVVRTPVFRAVQRNGKQEQETIYRDFLTPMGIPSLGYDAYDIAADRPDLAFISQPYEGCTLPQFWPENLAKHTRLIYLPYYLPYTVAGHDDITAMAQMPVHRFAWKVACSGKKHNAFYCRHAENKGANALVTGLPKTDPIVTARQKPLSLPDGWEVLQSKTVFLWNSWYDLVKSSLRYFDTLLEWFNAHKDCALIWRPHPMCDTVTKLYYPDQYPVWQEMLRRAEAAENVLVDKEVSFLAAFTTSHAMISDTSSMLPQYLLLDKPTLWTKSRLTGEEFIDCRWMEQAGRAEDILAFLERVRDHEDRNAALRTAICKRDLPLADGHCGERLCEAIWNALQEESGA